MARASALAAKFSCRSMHSIVLQIVANSEDNLVAHGDQSCSQESGPEPEVPATRLVDSGRTNVDPARS